MTDHQQHVPVVRVLQGEHVITCEVCGLLLDFRQLELLGFNVSDWDAPKYEAPDQERDSS